MLAILQSHVESFARGLFPVIDFAQPDFDMQQPLDGRQLARALGLDVVDGDPSVDLRFPGWLQRLERIMVREHGFEWHRVLRAPVIVPFADVAHHDRAIIFDRRYARRAELIVERYGGTSVVISSAPGMSELAARLDEVAQARSLRSVVSR